MDLSTVNVVISPGQLARVGAFRYGVYVQEQGKHAQHADHEARMLIEPADRAASSVVYDLERDEDIVASLRIEFLEAHDHAHAQERDRDARVLADRPMALGRHPRVHQDLRHRILRRWRGFALPGFVPRPDVVGRVVIRDVLQGVGDALDEVILLDRFHDFGLNAENILARHDARVSAKYSP